MQVLTGDIIDSTLLSHQEKERVESVFEELASASNGRYDFFIRGDSFQVLIENKALQEALIIKSKLKYGFDLSARISIGIGPITHLDEKLSNSDGPAFWLSGQGLDEMKNNKTLISIHTENKKINAEWAVHSATLDFLEMQITQNQAEVIYWLLKDKTQQEIASQIGITQSSVNRRIKSSGWSLIEKIVQHYTHIEE